MYGKTALQRIGLLSRTVDTLIKRFLPGVEFNFSPVKMGDAGELWDSAASSGAKRVYNPMSRVMKWLGTAAGLPVEGCTFKDGQVTRISATTHGRNPLGGVAGFVERLVGTNAAVHELAHALQFTVLGAALKLGILRSPEEFWAIITTSSSDTAGWAARFSYQFGGDIEWSAQTGKSTGFLSTTGKGTAKTGTVDEVLHVLLAHFRKRVDSGERYERFQKLVSRMVGAIHQAGASSIVPPRGSFETLGTRTEARAKELIRGKGASGDLDASIAASHGSSLPSGVRSYLEPALGQSFSSVRIHTDAAAATAAQSIGAEAFTLGSDIYFNRGFFNPSSARGVALIGHELTHVAQARGGAKTLRPAPRIRRRGNADDSYTYDPIDYKRKIDPSIDAELAFKGAANLYGDIDVAVRAYGKPVSFEDPQKFASWSTIKDFYTRRIGDADFVGAVPGMSDITGDLEKWLGAAFKGSGVSQSELLLEALKQTGGRITLAMGALAKILHDHRYWASKVRGLRCDTKDYYLYTGAYIGMHESSVIRSVGHLGGVTNILTNPIGAVALGIMNYYGGWASGDDRMRRAGGRLLDLNYLDGIHMQNKFVNFYAGLGGGSGYMEGQRPTIKAINEWLMKKSSFEVAGHDSYEEQALQNERAILTAMKMGAPLVGLSASMSMGPSGGGRGRPKIRRKTWMSEWWDEVGTEGATQGGFWGWTKAGFAAFASGVTDPSYLWQQSKAYAKGFGIGAWNSVKGMVNMVLHPIQTAEGVYNLVVHWDRTKAALGDKVEELLQLASTNPELFAQKCGEIAGEIDMALVGPKAIAGTRDVVGFIKSAKNIRALGGKTLWYYSDAAGAQAIKASNTIGKAGATEVFATPMDPLLQQSKSLIGRTASTLATGGSLDFARVGWKLVVKVKSPFTVATAFEGGAFTGIALTKVETAMLRLVKSLGGQYAAMAPQQVRILAQQALANPVLSLRYFEALDAAASSANLAGNAAVRAGESKRTDEVSDYFDSLRNTIQTFRELIKEMRGDTEPRRKKRGTSRFDDDDPELGRRFETIIERRGREPGVSLDISTKMRLERFLGRDLGEVRIHTGPLARELARATEAEALTVGRDIYLPGSTSAAVLAHEATHVAQVAPATPTVSPRSLGAGSVESMETAARRMESRFAAGPARVPAFEPVIREAPAVFEPAPVALEAAPVQRKAEENVAPTSDAPSPEGARDPVQQVMKQHGVPGTVSPEEFLEICTDRIMALLRDEITLDSERRETVKWDETYPLP